MPNQQHQQHCYPLEPKALMTFMMVTIYRFWRLNFDVDDIFLMLGLLSRQSFYFEAIERSPKQNRIFGVMTGFQVDFLAKHQLSQSSRVIT